MKAVVGAWIKSDVLRVERVADTRAGRDVEVVFGGDNHPAKADE